VMAVMNGVDRDACSVARVFHAARKLVVKSSPWRLQIQNVDAQVRLTSSASFRLLCSALQLLWRFFTGDSAIKHRSDADAGRRSLGPECCRCDLSTTNAAFMARWSRIQL
jgi:hypothetical protein